MKSFVLLAALTLLLACHKDDDENNKIDELLPYVNAFVEQTKIHQLALLNRDVSVQFLDAEKIAPNVITYNIDRGQIMVNHDVWLTYNDAQREILMYNALARVMLGRTTNSDRLADCPQYYKSIMNNDPSYVAYESLKSERRQYYIDEVFVPDTPSPSWCIK